MRYVGVAVLFGVLGVSYLAMRRGWRRRARRDADLAPLEAPPTDPGAELCSVEGTYLGTTSEGDWLDRIVAQGLGAPAAGSARVTQAGLTITRRGAQPIWLAAHKIDRVTLDSAQAGKVLPNDAVVLITWHHDERGLDTGFTPRRSADRTVLVDAIRQLVREAA